MDVDNTEDVDGNCASKANDDDDTELSHDWMEYPHHEQLANPWRVRACVFMCARVRAYACVYDIV